MGRRHRHPHPAGPRAAPGIGYVIQQAGLFPHRKVADNIATVPQLLGWDKDRIAPGSTSWPTCSASTPTARPLPGGAVRAASSSGSASPARWPPTRRCCSWTSPTRRSTPSCGPACRTSCSTCSARCTRRSCSSPTTSTRPSSSPTASPSSTSAACSSRSAARGAAAGAGRRLRGRLPGRRPGHQAPVAHAGRRPLSRRAGGRAHRHGRRGPRGHGRARHRLGRRARRRPPARLGRRRRRSTAAATAREPNPGRSPPRPPRHTLKAALDGIVTSAPGWRSWSARDDDGRATSACSPSTTWPRGSPVSGRAGRWRRAVRPLGLGRRPHRRDRRRDLSGSTSSSPCAVGIGFVLAGAGARRRPLALDLRAAGRLLRGALRHPQPGAVRRADPHPRLRARVPPAAGRAGQLHAADPAAEHRRRPRRRAPEVREAADGMGYERWRRVLRVDLPLATPAIVAGLRIATVTTIGPGHRHRAHRRGRLRRPHQRRAVPDFPTPIVVGAVLSVALAIAFDVLFVLSSGCSPRGPGRRPTAAPAGRRRSPTRGPQRARRDGSRAGDGPIA